MVGINGFNPRMPQGPRGMQGGPQGPRGMQGGYISENPMSMFGSLFRHPRGI